MKTVASVRELRALRLSGIGFVPTMGALHEGHLELVRMAKQTCSSVVVSIFVNPTQFNDPQDLQRYPRPLDKDLHLLSAEGVDAVFLPTADEMYADGYRFSLSENQDSKVLCGPKRPGHFEGVLTVVLKLINAVQPTHAFFGEKDFQQLKLISEMAAAFFIPTVIVPCPTVREPDGLAMSSRNLLLNERERELAPLLYRILKTSITCQEARTDLEKSGFVVDYVEEHWGRRFAAAFLGKVRLIDNVAL